MMYDVVIIGAGPAGLTAAYLLSKKGKSILVLESDPEYVGGISRTVRYKGYLFDIGGHRFFTKSPEVEALWYELLPNDLITSKRQSRILYNNNYFDYPLSPLNALSSLGLFESILCMVSYIRAKIFPIKKPKSFKEWVTNAFGHRLYSIFFETYTEKVWGLKCSSISADWAAQRIKELSLGKAIVHSLKSLLPRKTPTSTPITSLIDSFLYPRLGPGMLWEEAARRVRQQGGSIINGATAKNLAFDSINNTWEISYTMNTGEIKKINSRNIISSAPLRDIAMHLSPPLNEQSHAEKLRYRDFIVVVLIAHDRKKFRDHWIYIHDPKFRVGRIQNYKNWSSSLVPDSTMTCYGMEYFCFDHDDLWEMSSEDLISMARREFVGLGLGSDNDIVDGTVVKQPKAYPVYDEGYTEHLNALKNEITTKYPGLHLIGRNGMHRYNNQDHSMMTAILVVDNILLGTNRWDIWAVNQDALYHETRDLSALKSLRDVPRTL